MSKLGTAEGRCQIICRTSLQLSDKYRASPRTRRHPAGAAAKGLSPAPGPRVSATSARVEAENLRCSNGAALAGKFSRLNFRRGLPGSDHPHSQSRLPPTGRQAAYWILQLCAQCHFKPASEGRSQAREISAGIVIEGRVLVEHVDDATLERDPMIQPLRKI